jgi:NAD(P)-dependent dehydrogenase (short-subunit alcohol dehydrogenase family)
MSKNRERKPDKLTRGPFDLRGKTGVVVGAGRGLGKQIASTLSHAGAETVVVDLPEMQETLRTSAEEISSASGERVHPVGGDVSGWESVQELHENVRSICPRVDILVNVAGVQIRKPTIEFTSQDWDRVININMRGTFRCCQVFARGMMQSGWGRIINIASLNSVVSLPERTLYCMSKAGVVAMTKSLAIEWAKHNITVNAISPGYFVTEMTAPLFQRPDWVERLMMEIPCQRPGMPSDLDGLVLLLASEASDYITGQNLLVDGGFTAGEMI